MDQVEQIAVIGMAGRFPGADDLAAFWANLAAGASSFVRFEDDELLANGESPERLASPSYVRVRPLTPAVDLLDLDLFGLSPQDAELRDPQHRVFLEVAHSTFEHAGYDPHGYPGRIGVFAGANVSRYREINLERSGVAGSVGSNAVDFATLPDYLTTFVSYKLGLRGPSFAVQAACSTSLVAVHLACQAIRAGDCDMAVAGGVDVELPMSSGYTYVDGGMFARDGVPRPFDQDATGTNFGSGAGAVLLKRLSAALADGDHVHAVLLGSAVTNDGDRKAGFAAPGVDGQADCVEQAMERAGVAPAAVSYVEAHATGTRVGDPIEVAALTKAYRRLAGGRPLAAGSCGLGSVKGNIGHLGQAAGISGLIKTVLALGHEQLPASVNFRAANPALDLARGPFFVTDAPRPWPRRPEAPRRAGVSSFGIGGTNAHVVVGEAPGTPDRTPPARRRELIVWSAVDDAAEERLRATLAEHFAGLAGAAATGGSAGSTGSTSDFADAAYTLRVGRTPRARRGAVLAEDAGAAAAALDGGAVIRGGARSSGFRFGAMGPDEFEAALSAYRGEPVVRDGCDAAFGILAPLLDGDPREHWLAGPIAGPEAAPFQFTAQYTLAHYLMHLGARPGTFAGSGVGALAAAAVAGVFSMAEGLRIAVALATKNRDAYLRAIAAAEPRRPRGVLLLDGEPVPADVAGSRTYWSERHLDIQAAADTAQDPSLLDIGGTAAVDELLAILWTAGEPVDFHRRDAGLGYRRIPMPGYPYRRTRHWIEDPGPQGRSAPPGEDGTGTGDVEADLLRMCAETLALPGLRVDDDLLDLGVDSLGAVRVAMCVQQRFGVEMNASTVLDLGTVHAVSALVAEVLTGGTVPA